jgi:hypothetical protein
MIQLDSITFSDFHQFLLLLRAHHRESPFRPFLSLPLTDDTLSNISLIAYSAIPMKITTSRSISAKAVFEMFIEFLVTYSDPCPSRGSSGEESIVNKTIDLVNRFILTPTITGDDHLESLLTLLYGLRAIELCRSLVTERRTALPLHPTLAERYAHRRHAKHQKALVTALLAEKSRLDHVSDLCPSCADICSSPLLFAETISTLRLYELKYTKYESPPCVTAASFSSVLTLTCRKFGPDRRPEVRKLFQDLGSHFERAFRPSENKSVFQTDFCLLYAAFLQGSGKSKEVPFLGSHSSSLS